MDVATHDISRGAKPKRHLRLALFGAAPDTPNLGVSALFHSTISGLAGRIGPVEFIVFDNGLGERRDQFLQPGLPSVPLTRFGARMGRRYYRPEHLEGMGLAAKLGRTGAWFSRGIELIDSCDAVLDVSGGDSFSDIYGWRRFKSVYLPKAIATARGKPLILLPQTYGPYGSHRVRKLAARAASSAEMAWARDEESFGQLKALVGTEFDARRHKVGVDMAFGLKPTSAEPALGERVLASLERTGQRRPLIGFNVSGLIWHLHDGGMRDYGLKADYRQTTITVLRTLLAKSDARVVLIPHVIAPFGHYESDPEACALVEAQLPEFASRIVTIPPVLSASEVKWLIMQMDWFCGTRMHSTIAGLSTGVPTAAIAYSDKTRGVFGSCGMAEAVFDPRTLDASEIADGLLCAFENRHAARAALEKALPSVREALELQFDSIADTVRGLFGAAVQARSAA